MTKQQKVLRLEVFTLAHKYAGTCTLCGQKYEQTAPTAVVAIFDTEDNTFLGEVCASCIEAGKGEAKDRIDTHIERLVDQIKSLRGLARDLDFATWPTFGEVSDTVQRFDTWRELGLFLGARPVDQGDQDKAPGRPTDLFTEAGKEEIPF